MNSSESIKELALALAKAQGDIEKAEKDKDNPHFRSKYADLGNVVDAIKPALVSNGLAFTQICHEADNAAKIETIIIHSSGEWLSCGCISVPVSKNDAQGFGSALTYARRYSLSAAFGVAPEDDDGNAAAKAAPKKPQQPPQQPAQSSAPSEKDAEYIQRIKDALKLIYGDDKAAALDKIEELTSFVPKGKTEADRVKGVRDFTKLSGQRLSILAHSVERMANQ